MTTNSFQHVHFSLESKESDGDKSQLGNVTLQFLIPGTSEPVSALVRIHATFLCHHSNDYYFHHCWCQHHLSMTLKDQIPMFIHLHTCRCIQFNLLVRGGTLRISGWGCAARTLEPLAYTRAIFSWILLPHTRVNSWFP